MHITIRNDSVHISGYVNAVERNSKNLYTPLGCYVEKVEAGAFHRALEKAGDNLVMLLNHDDNRKIASIKDGNMTAREDAIGLKVEATITDAETLEKARGGELCGWSFGFFDDKVDIDREQEPPLRYIRDLELVEVSLLDSDHEPAYAGTLVEVRSGYDKPIHIAATRKVEPTVSQIETRQQNHPLVREWAKIIASLKEES